MPKELYIDNVDNFFDVLYKGNQKRTTAKKMSQTLLTK